jgi:hypothetical protein
MPNASIGMAEEDFSDDARFECAFAPFASTDRRFALAHADARDISAYAALRSCLTSASSSTSSSASSSASPSPPLFDLLLTDPPYCLLTSRRDGRVRDASPRKKLLWDPTGAASSLRFVSTAAYADFTCSWLRPLVSHVRPQAPWIIWTNSLGRAPIQQAVRQLRPDMRLWSELLWIKPAKPAAATTAKQSATTEHHVASQHDNSAAVISSGATSSFYSSALTAPWRSSLPAPLSLPLTSSELSFRAYECALIFGVGALEDSEWNASARMLPSALVCPYEDELLPPSEAAAAASANSSALGTAPLHPNCKPLRVLLPLLHAYSHAGALAVDPFGGSGAHAHASLAAGRRAATLERSPLWARHIRDTLGVAMGMG